MQSYSHRWTALYPANIAPDLHLDHGDVLSSFRSCVAARPDAAVIHYFDQTTSYQDLDIASDAVAVWLQAHDVVAGNRVAIIAQNMPGFVIAMVAAWKCGAVPVPVNPMYRKRELSRILSDAQPAAIFCQDHDHTEVQAAIADAGLQQAAVLVLSPSEGQGRDDRRVLPAPADTPGAATLSGLIATLTGQRPTPAMLTADTLGLILYTSGTTGAPKGAMLTHRSLLFNAQVTRDWCQLGPDTLILAIAPLFHITGVVCHICTAFAAQCGMLMNYRFEPGVVLDMIRFWHPTYTIGAITAFNALMRVPGIQPADVACFRHAYSGGATIPAVLLAQIEQRIGLVIRSSYGMTETAAPAVFALPDLRMPIRNGIVSIGLPIPSTEIRIVDDDGADVPTGTSGELLIRGPQVMTGYWNKPEETAVALAGGWLHSGDVGFLDEAGWVYLVDRKKDVIVASGFKVWPGEVEEVLYGHPDIREAAVVGVPDAYRGETVKAFVSLRADAETSEAALIAYCRENLAAYKVPRTIEVIAELPKTVSGKIQRAALRRAGSQGGV